MPGDGMSDSDGHREERRARAAAQPCPSPTPTTFRVDNTVLADCKLPRILGDVIIGPAARSRLTGGTGTLAEAAKPLRVRLVQVASVDGLPQVVAECSDTLDATGVPVWRSAQGLPCVLVLAAVPIGVAS